MSVAVKIGIVGFGLLIATAAYEAYTQADPPEVVAAQAAVSRDIARKLVDSLPADARWNRVSIDDARSGSYRLTLHYAPGKAGPPEIETDTKAVAQGMLLQLAMAGRHPGDERTVIAVSARQDEAGSLLGAARFDPAADRIVYEPPSP
ncbi:MAG: hypothetical protein JWM91_3370 [Rhodospirillales bacterium]|nr:hypothetical protein [Rhodospirillales bacterium]